MIYVRLYRFSPIQDEEQLFKAVNYIAKGSTKLCKKIIGKPLPTSSLTIFSHYSKEYEQLTNILLGLGTKLKEQNGIYVTLDEPISVGKHLIKQIRIRQPDPYRMQVGCNDFEVKDYHSFKKEYLNKFPQNLRLIERSDYEMIEFCDPAFDVLAYVVSK